MISYDLPPGRFNLRAAAIAIRDGHVLIHRATFQDYWSLPGGRVEWGESSEQTVARELEEELGVRGEVAHLLFVRESVFSDQGKRYHELGYYFRVSLPDSFPFRTDGEICHRCRDGRADLEFKWVPGAGEALGKLSRRVDRIAEHDAGAVENDRKFCFREKPRCFCDRIASA
jgi:ADP-ribose pyrophosphatase YjhB (NUDIX family)